MSYFRRLILALCSFTGAIFLYGQKENNLDDLTKEEILQITEKKYGSDDLLINGVKFHAEKIKAKGSPNFDWNESIDTRLFVKGRPYFNVSLKYDLVKDKLILSKVLEDGYKRQLVLNSTFVDSFYLGNHAFINFYNQNEIPHQFEYFEKIYAGKKLFLKKYRKKFITVYNNWYPDGKYSSQQYTYYIHYRGSLAKVNSKKAFLSVYDSYRKEIRKFMRKNKIKYKSATKEELIKLMTFCHAKSIQNN